MIYKNKNISIVVKDNRIESPGYKSLVFERPSDFAYDSGDWIDIEFDNRNLKGGRTYSLSSSPTEPNLMITFKDGVSEIKKSLAAAKPGDKLSVVQYGNDYKFTLKPNKASSLIAGGVGIAPFRSMLQEMVDLGDRNTVNLIYLNKTPDFLFRSELEHYAELLSNLSITYIVTKDLKNKDKASALFGVIQDRDQSFYIAGPGGMVEATEHLLLDYGVLISNVKIDSFDGY